MSEPGVERVSLTAFLSHKYEAVGTNLFFFGLFDKVADIQFEVDRAVNATNVTRLERSIRNSDAFVGIFPAPQAADRPETIAELGAASRYFRLELELAVRSGKPALVFFDERLAQVLHLPRSVRAESFSLDDIEAGGRSPRQRRYERIVSEFCVEVSAAIARSDARVLASRPDRIGLAVPHGIRGGYTDQQVNALEAELANAAFTKVDVVQWPPVLGGDLLRTLEMFDFVVTDVGPASADAALIGYLHGTFVPLLRLAKGVRSNADLVGHPIYRTLHGWAGVGYPKDVVCWSSNSALRKGVASRLANIKAAPELIGTRKAAQRYFTQAALRNEVVFVSYSGADEALARPVARALRTKFQTVFDYRDGESITPGQPWLEEIFSSLSRSAIGIALVSDDYLRSGNCKHEAREMVARADAGLMHLVPVKLSPAELEMERPPWMSDRQYLHLYDYPSDEDPPEKIAEAVVRFYEQSEVKG